MSIKQIPFSLKIILDIVFIYSIHKFQQNKGKGTRKDCLIETHQITQLQRRKVATNLEIMND